MLGSAKNLSYRQINILHPGNVALAAAAEGLSNPIVLALVVVAVAEVGELSTGSRHDAIRI